MPSVWTISSTGLPMNSADERPLIDFGAALGQALDRAGWTPSELARQIGVTRQHVTKLRNGGAKPSAELVRSICEALLKKSNPVPFRDVTALALAAVGIRGSDRRYDGALLANQPFTLDHELRKTTLLTRTIVSDVIGEVFYSEILDDTIEQMNKSARYFYFLLPGSTQRQSMLARVAERGTEALALVKEWAYFIESPESLFIARLRIDNIGEPTQEACYCVGSEQSPAFHNMQPATADRITSILLPVVLEAPSLRAQTEETTTVKIGGMSLQFRLDL